jgi:DNA repair exonuclease SbcCD ATPase subunit
MSTSLEDQVAALAEARQRGEELALALARAGQRARQSELEREIGELRNALETARRDRDARQRTVQLVATLIEALRGASADVVENQLRRLEPLLQRIYATADPHPAFRVVRLLSRMRQGRGRILSSVADPVYNIESESPASVLSSSQMNVLAVSVFLALNLGMPALPLSATILDDPLQSLDDLNLLGLIDLLRRIRERRQVMVSTHDTRFAALLERKLRPVAEGQRTVVISMQGWSREGPTVEQREVERDRVPVRIAV